MFLPLILLFVGCSAFTRQRPDTPQRLRNIQTITVVPPRISVYQIGSSGQKEEIPEWGTTASSSISSAVRAEMESRGFKTKTPAKTALGAYLEENVELFSLINTAAISHTHPKSIEYIPYMAEDFDYTLGREVQRLCVGGCPDAFLFAVGFDHERTSGAIAMNVLNGLTLGLAGNRNRTLLDSLLSVGLVDARSGELIWFASSFLEEPNMSFKDSDTVKKKVKWLFKNFPR